MSTQSTSIEPARLTLRERKRALYRTVILDAAEAVFAADGYDAAQVTHIAKTAGVSLTTMYSVLPSKWEIYRAVNGRRLSQLMKNAHGIVGDGASAFTTLLAGIRMQLEFLMSHQNYTRIQLRDVAGWSTVGAQRTPEQEQGLRFGLQLYAGLFRQAIDDGVFVEEDPEVMARMVIANQQVRLALWVERGCKQNMTEVIHGMLRQLIRSWSRPECVQRLLEQVQS